MQIGDLRRLKSVTVSAPCFIFSLSTRLCFISACPKELWSEGEGGFCSSKQISLNHCDRISSYGHALSLVTPYFTPLCVKHLCAAHKQWVIIHYIVGVSRIIQVSSYEASVTGVWTVNYHITAVMTQNVSIYLSFIFNEGPQMQLKAQTVLNLPVSDFFFLCE